MQFGVYSEYIIFGITELRRTGQLTGQRALAGQTAGTAAQASVGSDIRTSVCCNELIYISLDNHNFLYQT